MTAKLFAISVLLLLYINNCYVTETKAFSNAHMNVLSCRKESHVSEPSKPGWNRSGLCEFDLRCWSLDFISAGSILRAFSVCGWNWNWIFFEGLQDEKLSSFGILQSPWGRLKKLCSTPLFQPPNLVLFKSFGSALLWQSLFTRKNGQRELRLLTFRILENQFWLIHSG